jgi:hypothetical protein
MEQLRYNLRNLKITQLATGRTGTLNPGNWFPRLKGRMPCSRILITSLSEQVEDIVQGKTSMTTKFHVLISSHLFQACALQEASQDY